MRDYLAEFGPGRHIWAPKTTCQCVFDFVQFPNTQANLKEVLQKCKLHAAIPDNDIVNQVIAHHTGFHLKFGNQPTKGQADQIKSDCETEYQRIKGL